MGMIINRSFAKFFKGYPTRHPAPWVVGATLEGSADVYFGDLVKFGSEAGAYEAITSALSDVSEVAGFVLATNVKLAEADFRTVPTKPGQQFNLIKEGFMAIELDADAVATDIVDGGEVRVILATGKCTTSSQTSGSAAYDKAHFTGKYEVVGSAILAEIYVK